MEKQKSQNKKNETPTLIILPTKENERRQWRVEISVGVIKLLDMRVYSLTDILKFIAIKGSPALVILYWCLSFRLFNLLRW